MTQLLFPNTNITYEGGWCLEAARSTLGIPIKYPTATAAWNGGDKHYGVPPLGFDFPVFFSLSKEPRGHVAIRLANGTVASSTLPGIHKPMYIHPTIADLVRMYTNSSNGICTYLGYSYTLNGVAVVKEGDIEMDTGKFVLETYLNIGHRQLNLNNKTDKAIYDEKVAWLNAGGNTSGFIEDIAATAQIYFTTGRMVRDIYYPYSGKHDSTAVVNGHINDIIAGKNPVTVLNELAPKGQPDPVTVEESRRYKEIEKICDA